MQARAKLIIVYLKGYEELLGQKSTSGSADIDANQCKELLVSNLDELGSILANCKRLESFLCKFASTAFPVVRTTSPAGPWLDW